MSESKIETIHCKSFPKNSDREYWKISPHTLRLDYFEEKGHSKEYALVEAVLSGDRGTITLRLHPEVQYTVYDEKVHFKFHPMDFSSIFKSMIEYIRIAWVTKDTFDKFMVQLRSPNIKVGLPIRNR